ncbi:MAG: CPBP family intramembrane metalloprotease [Patescibacteria group bacterium]|nr:CPBP family intramembrane metalloprotease [Patescibacteria group bacterium]
MLLGISGKSKDVPITTTIKQAGMLAVAMHATLPVSSRIEQETGIMIGNRGVRDPEEIAWAEANPGLSLLYTTVGAPVSEEWIFRGVPNLLLRRFNGTLWKVGVPIAALFSSVHNLKHDKASGQIELESNALPAYQFLSGLFLWKIVRERGYLHAVAAHSTINTLAVSINFLGSAGERVKGLK